MMGSPDHEPDRQKNEMLHRVCVKRFQLAVHEVSIAEFRQFVIATNHISDAEINFQVKGCWSVDKKQRWNWYQWSNWNTPVGLPVTDNSPVTCVSFYDIMQYIQWLNTVTGEVFRLPTEAEWEYAARAGSNSAYFWGNNPDLACRFANGADQTVWKNLQWPVFNQCTDNFFFVSPIKSFLPNRFGLYDMSGNVWEWTCSRYQENYSGKELECIDQDEVNTSFVVVRGGGWNADPGRLRSAYRSWHSPWVRMATWGFRLVKEFRYRR